MTEPEISPQDVPDDLVEALLAAANDACVEMPHFEARRILAGLLPATYRYWFAAAFGSPEAIAAREAAAAPRTPDDTVDLCEMARPGEHERRVRERMAAELETLREDVVNKDKPYNQAFMHGVDCAIRTVRGAS